MISTRLNWYRPLERKPVAGQCVLVHMPHDERPIQVGYTYRFAAWFNIDGNPLRHQVKHWAAIPTPPAKGKR